MKAIADVMPIKYNTVCKAVIGKDWKMDELIDIYDENRVLTGEVLPRKTKLPKGKYMLYVIALIRNSEGRILVTKRSLDKKWAPGSWEIPGGGAAKGETSFDAVKREVFEETGIRITKEKSQIVYSYRNDDESGDNYFTDIFVCDADFTVDDVKVQEREIIDVKLVTFDEIDMLHEKDGFLHYDRIQKAMSEWNGR